MNFDALGMEYDFKNFPVRPVFLPFPLKTSCLIKRAGQSCADMIGDVFSEVQLGQVCAPAEPKSRRCKPGQNFSLKKHQNSIKILIFLDLSRNPCKNFSSVKLIF